MSVPTEQQIDRRVDEVQFHAWDARERTVRKAALGVVELLRGWHSIPWRSHRREFVEDGPINPCLGGHYLDVRVWNPGPYGGDAQLFVVEEQIRAQLDEAGL